MKRAILSLLALVAATGCGPTFAAATPPQFVEIENDWDEYEYRATSADGLVLAVREVEHDPEGTAEFWVKAVENRMRHRGGYALLGKKAVKTKQGLTGTKLEFGHDESGQPHLYNVAVFVTEDHIYVLEQGGTKELMSKHAAQLDWYIENFWVK